MKVSNFNYRIISLINLVLLTKRRTFKMTGEAYFQNYGGGVISKFLMFFVQKRNDGGASFGFLTIFGAKMTSEATKQNTDF